jgi:hypothetical protein
MSHAVALAAAKDAFSHKMQERGNTNAKFWSAGVLQALGGERHWHQVGLRQLRCDCRQSHIEAALIFNKDSPKSLAASPTWSSALVWIVS